MAFVRRRGNTPIVVTEDGTPVLTNPNKIAFTGAGSTASDDGSGGVVVDIPGGGGGGGGSPLVTIAAVDTPSTQKANATTTCDGVNDEVQINAALVTGGYVQLLPGTFTLGAGLVVGTIGTVLEAGGATIRWTTVTGRTPIIQVKASRVSIQNAKIQGSASKGNGIAILLVGDTTGVHDVEVWSPEILNCDTGVEFGIVGTDSTGDCALYGGAIHDCKSGVRCPGFTNRVYGGRVYSCDIGIDVTNDRVSGKIETYGVTISQWATQAIRIRGGQGSTFHATWMEHTDAALTPTEAVRIGGLVALGDATDREAADVRFTGTTKMTLQGETYGIRLDTCRNLYVEDLAVSTNGTAPTAVVRAESTSTGKGNRINRITLGPGSSGLSTGFVGGGYPAAWSNASTTGDLIVEEHFCAENSPVGSTIGRVKPVSDSTYSIFKMVTGTITTYFAKEPTGHIRLAAADTGTTSGLKAVLEGLAADGVMYHFTHTPENGTFTRFHLLDAPLGSEAWANTQTGLSFQAVRGITFRGDGMERTILSTRTNTSTASPDLSVLLFTNCFGVTVQHLGIEFCGNFMSTMEAINCNQGYDFLFDRVRFTASRNSALIIDGGDKGRVASRNVVRNCIFQGRPRAPQLSLITQAGGLSTNTYRYAVVWVDADLAGVATAGDTMPSEWTAVTTDASNTKVDVYIDRGPYTCTARKILRWDSTNGWRLLTTISDNTTAVYRDDNSATPSAYTFTDLSTIKSCGIHLLGSQNAVVMGNVVDGVGSDSTNSVQGTNQFGINVVRKSVVPTTANRNRIIGNSVTKSGQHGIRISGGNENLVIGNTVVNPGIPAVKAQGVRIEGVSGVTTDRNLVSGNVIVDDQDANTPVIGTPGGTMNNGITITSTNTPTGNQVTDNIIQGQVTTATPISDSGTNSVIRHEGFGRTTAVTTTYTALTHDTFVLADATGGAFTVTLPSVTAMNGKEILVKKVDSSANAVTVSRAGSATIDGATTFSLATQYKYIRLVSNGTLWFNVASN